MRNQLELSLSDIKEDLLNGKPVIVYDFDNREEEADMVFYGGKITWESINKLRREAGGLICYVTGGKEASSLGLKFLSDEWKNHPVYNSLVKKPSYGDYPAFMIWVNHISVSTGISDSDRATTIRELHRVIADHVRGKTTSFLNNFYAPGHVPILASSGLDVRRGHTELVTHLAETLGLPRSMVISEMLGDGKSLSRELARSYAAKNGLHFIEGKEILRM
ncbi:MAG: 3,4-dihydroxy-2-butanone-4-phosphate synthase [Thermoplasmatales archaeon]